MAAVMCCNPERGEMDTLNWKTCVPGCVSSLFVVIPSAMNLSSQSRHELGSMDPRVSTPSLRLRLFCSFPQPANTTSSPLARLPRSLSLTLSPSSLSPFLPAHTSHTIDACARCIILEIPLQLAHSSTLHHFSQHPSLLQTARVQQQRHAKRLFTNTTTFEHSPAIRITTTQPPS